VNGASKSKFAQWALANPANGAPVANRRPTPTRQTTYERRNARRARHNALRRDSETDAISRKIGLRIGWRASEQARFKLNWAMRGSAALPQSRRRRL